MHYKTYLISAYTLCLMLLSLNNFAQDGGADLRFLIHSLDCENAEICFDIELRASEPGREFYLSEQNYRFGLNREITLNPSLSEELDVSGLIVGDGTQGYSLYNEHTLTGSLDTIVSYNIELAGGDGIYIGANDYVSVGRICFEVLDFDQIFTLNWIVGELPPTFVGEMYNGQRYNVEIVSVLDYYHDFSGVCDNTPPVAIDDFATIDPNGHITICLPENDTDAENGLDITSTQLLNMPPPSEGTVSLDPETGCITFIAAEGFMGLSTFDYQICDKGTSIPAYGGDANPQMIPEPDPQDPDIAVIPPACDMTTVEITVGTVGLILAENDAALFNLATFPNPADEVVNISYTLPEKSEVSIALWNVLGQPVQTLQPETLSIGKYNKSLNVSELSEGNYLLVLNINGKMATKMIQIN